MIYVSSREGMCRSAELQCRLPTDKLIIMPDHTIFAATCALSLFPLRVIFTCTLVGCDVVVSVKRTRSLSSALSEKVKLLIRWASTTIISIWAKRWPTQFLGPALKGTYWKGE